MEPIDTVSNGPKNLAVLMVTVLTRVFLQENMWPFCWVVKKSGRNNKVTVSPRLP